VYDEKETIESFLAATAAKQPTPAAGSVAALAGALSAALGHMVMAISAGKPHLAQHDAQQNAAREEFARAQRVFTQLMVDDQAAVKAMLASAGKSSDPAALEAIAATSIRIPQALAETAVAVLEACDRAADMIHAPLAADLAACADLAMAAARTGVNIVRVNSRFLSNAADRTASVTAADDLQSRALAAIQRFYPRIWQTEPAFSARGGAP
jgi:glutamate formiminotransferase/glutamate formiminotransferase/formiminotetrahydrofolate cyclodeaminase